MATNRSNTKPTVTEPESRMTVKYNPQLGIQNYDVDNGYPQRIEKAKKASGRTTQCLNVYTRFVRGGGFADPFYKTIVNEKKKLTVDRLHRAIVADYCLYRGFAIHLNFNALGQIVSMDHIPFKELRLGLEDGLTGVPSVVKHHPDWTKENGKQFKQSLITEFSFFNPNQILDEVVKLGGLDKSKGQIYWWSANGWKYPEASCDPVLEDVVSDDETKQFRLSNISTNFLAAHILEINECENDDERDAIDERVTEFQGGKRGGKFMILEKKGTETTFNLQKVEPPDMDGLYQKTEDAVKESIRSNYMIPPVLVGDLVAGKLGTSQEIQDATLYFNTITSDERMIFEEVFTELFNHWHIESANQDGNYSIMPVKFGQDSILVERLGVGGTQALQTILIDTVMQPDQKVEVLIQVFGIAEENARKMVGKTPNQQAA